jgi:hypothetical protein
MLEEKTHLPAVLQSLGCIAETAMPVFETRESEIENFIINKILKCSNVWLSRSTGLLQLYMTLSYKFSLICASLSFLMYVHGLLFQKAEDDTRASWDDRSELCLLKVGNFGEICTLVLLEELLEFEGYFVHCDIFLNLHNKMCMVGYETSSFICFKIITVAFVNMPCLVVCPGF